MQLDRLMNKTMRRLMKAPPAVSDGAIVLDAQPAGADALRGSGSWANEWSGAKGAINRAKSLAVPGKLRGLSGSKTADEIPEGTIRPRPLMSVRDLKLHNWIADRLEAEAPTCSLHAGVALNAFLSSTLAHETFDPLGGMMADLLIVDEQGQAVAALIREKSNNPSMQLLIIDALLDADIPIIDIPARPSLAQLWSSISETLPN